MKLDLNAPKMSLAESHTLYYPPITPDTASAQTKKWCVWRCPGRVDELVLSLNYAILKRHGPLSPILRLAPLLALQKILVFRKFYSIPSPRSHRYVRDNRDHSFLLFRPLDIYFLRHNLIASGHPRYFGSAGSPMVPGNPAIIIFWMSGLLSLHNLERKTTKKLQILKDLWQVETPDLWISLISSSIFI